MKISGFFFPVLRHPILLPQKLNDGLYRLKSVLSPAPTAPADYLRLWHNSTVKQPPQTFLLYNYIPPKLTIEIPHRGFLGNGFPYCFIIKTLELGDQQKQKTVLNLSSPLHSEMIILFYHASKTWCEPKDLYRHPICRRLVGSGFISASASSHLSADS